MSFKTILSVSFTLICLVGFTQEEKGEKAKIEKQSFASVTLAYGIVPQGSNEDNIEKGHLVPAAGADYLYRVAPKWEVGIMVDFEFATYVIPRENNLIRERAFITVPVLAYNILPPWSLFVGYGIEFEKHKNLGIFRLGTEYSFPLKNRWIVPVGIFLDVKERYENFSFSVGLGRSF